MAINSSGKKSLVRTASETRMEMAVQEADALRFIHLHVTSLFFAKSFKPDYLTNNVKLHPVPYYHTHRDPLLRFLHFIGIVTQYIHTS